MPKEIGHQTNKDAMTDKSVCKISLLSCFAVITVFLSACGFAQWRDSLMRDVVEGCWHANPGQIPASSSGPSQTVEFYNASGRHVGYGVIGGETVDFYRADGSRAGYGKR